MSNVNQKIVNKKLVKFCADKLSEKISKEKKSWLVIDWPRNHISQLLASFYQRQMPL